MTRKRRLGKGLGALITEADTDAVSLSSDHGAGVPGEGGAVAVDLIRPNRYQPRRAFDPGGLAELAASIKAQGLVQPVVVNDNQDGTYEIISGERRLRAVKQLGWDRIPAIVRRVSQSELLEITLVENLQREDLNPMEQAGAFQRLIDEFGLTQADVAQRVGKDRATVANSLRLLRLSPVVQQEVASGRLTAGHARQLLLVEDQAEQIELARKVIEQEISVRRLEDLMRERKKREERLESPPVEEQKIHRPAHIVDLENRLCRHLGTQVRIRDGLKGRGKIVIDFYSFDEFERLLELLRVPLA